MLDIFRQVNIIAVLAHIALLAAITTLLYCLGLTLDLSALAAAMLYFLLSIMLRRWVPKDQNRGLALLQQGQYKEAQQAFEESYDYFTQNEWIDRYRLFTLLSASNVSYKEMALVNQALCYWLQKDLDAAKEAYKKVLQEFPKSKAAKDALNYIENPDEEEEENDEEIEDK